MQKMSEKEAAEALKKLFSEYELDLPGQDSLEVLHIAISALEEIHMMKKVFPDLTDEDIKMTATCLEELLQYRAIGTVEELQKSVKEEDILKFYYIESEDKYVVGQRVDNFYYAEIGKTGISYRMSRYLPWGQHVIAPETAWKEYTYPSEPKEIPFFEWLQGYIKKECGATVEECREAVERMKSKKPIMRYGCIYRCPPDCGGKEFDEYGDVPHCPTCNRVLHSLDDICKCGQKIDWSE